MKKVFSLLISLLFLCLITHSPDSATRFKAGDVIVKFKSDPIAATGKISSMGLKNKFNKFKVKKTNKLFEKQIRAKTTNSSPLDNIYHLEVPINSNILEICQELSQDPNVEFAEPNYKIKAFNIKSYATTPNDTYFSEQWGLTKIEAENGWDITTGSSAQVVAVVDTGVHYTHEDLSGKVILGYDYVNNDGDPADDNHHGTLVSGVIGAIANNGKGVAGVDWGCRILAVKVLDANGDGDNLTGSNGVVYAADNGANVINMSFGGADPGSLLQSACTYAYNKGIVLVAAAGNDGVSSLTYPASYSNVIGVAAVDESDIRSDWGSGKSSNYGSWVSVSAPGGAANYNTRIMTTYYNPSTPSLNNLYYKAGGTSLACPFVSGLAALIMSKNTSWTPAQVTAQILNTADDIDSINPTYAGQLGSGRINVSQALGVPLAEITYPTTNSKVSGTINIHGTAGGASFQSYLLEYGTGSIPVNWQTINQSTTSVSNSILGAWATSPGSNGTYTIKLTVTGSVSATDSILVNVDNPLEILGQVKYGPNPYNPLSGSPYLINYTISTDADIDFYIFDLTGTLLYKTSFPQTGGNHSISWNGQNMFGEVCQNGVYLFKLAVNKEIVGSGKILIIR